MYYCCSKRLIRFAHRDSAPVQDLMRNAKMEKMSELQVAVLVFLQTRWPFESESGLLNQF